MTPTELHYEEMLTDHRRLVRELDVLINGETAAEQASLCDIVAQLQREQRQYREGNPYTHPASHEPSRALKPPLVTVCALGHAFYRESHAIIRCPYCADTSVERLMRRLHRIKIALRHLCDE